MRSMNVVLILCILAIPDFVLFFRKKKKDLGRVCFFYLMLNRTFFELNAE